ncbi:52 kDa repressor of the inhibitor of the protein kinase-like [Anolis sagrei]|uniref:52 kDa repressor of the inhibitor of the protein kinase-like n=1 Tax=Anolis sagrei TaxID=38937 RepID=UPI0035203249
MGKKKKTNIEDQDSSRLGIIAAAVTNEGPFTSTPGLQNRKKLLPIVETIVLCGQQELALRGNNDSGPITCDEPLDKDGNFRALLRFHARSGDNNLKGHLETAALNAQYTTPQIQDELIEICGDKIVQKIVERCNAAQCFSVLVDETLDVSTSVQLSLSVRYVDVEAAGIREDFIGFVKISDMTGGGLAGIILKRLEKIGLNLKYLCGQGYGAANLSGHISGAQAIISQKYPLAVHTHCSAHSLNLALAKSCNIPLVRNCQGNISYVCNFFRASSIRLELLKKNIKDSFPESRAKYLLPLCETCWVERHDAVLCFVELYSVVVRTLEELNESPLYNSETSSEAWSLLLGVLNAEFVVTVHILRKFLSLSLQFSKALQRVDVNIFDCLQYVDLLIEEAREMRTKSVKKFQEIFDTAKSVVESMGEKVTIPCIYSRQSCENNMQAASLTPVEYYRLHVYIPFLDFFCNQLQERFTRHREVVQELQLLLPINCGRLKSNLNKCAELYNECLQNPDTLIEESDLWCRKWKKIAPAERPTNALEAYLVCDGQVFPNVKKLLQICATLPASTATNERLFSTSESLKRYVRSTMGQERLTGLALLSVHRSLSIDSDFCQSVLTQFSSVSNRRYGILL